MTNNKELLLLVNKIVFIAFVLLGALIAQQAYACNANNIRLTQEIKLSAAEKEFLAQLPTLKVGIVHAPPLTIYDDEDKSYDGIAPDILCFIAKDAHINYERIKYKNNSLDQNIQAIADKELDVFIPLSKNPGRKKIGLFSESYYSSFYILIAKSGNNYDIKSIDDISKYKVAVVKGSALSKTVKAIVPKENFIPYDLGDDMSKVYYDLRAGKFDIFVHNQNFFKQERYELELFDLEEIFILRNHPKKYRFFFSDTENNRKLIPIFNRYIENIDSSKSVIANDLGEKGLIEKYVRQKNNKFIFEIGIAAASLLIIFLIFLLYKYRSFNKKLTNSYRLIRKQQRQLKITNHKLEKISTTDTLTKLANRRYFDHFVKQRFNSLIRSIPISLFIIDIDKFKSVNDEYGHLTGDEYLRTVATIITKNVTRKTDLAARFGGEEFACLLPNTNAKEAIRIAEAIRVAIQQENLPNIRTELGILTVSIGIVTLDRLDCSATEFISYADKQLYIAKHLGRNNCQHIELPPYK